MRRLLAIVVLTYSTGCQQLPEPQSERAPNVAPSAVSTSANIYEIDPAQSQLTMRLYRSGPLANLGHNHVVSTTSLNGRIYVPSRFEDSEFELRFPVRSLVVDDPADRAAAGSDFSSVPSASDIEGTRSNMLGAELLDAENYPDIIVTGSFEESTATPQLAVTFQVTDTAATRTVPVTLSLQEDDVVVSGDFEMTHEELGLTPFSVMMGALRVTSEIRFRFRVTARRLREEGS